MEGTGIRTTLAFALILLVLGGIRPAHGQNLEQEFRTFIEAANAGSGFWGAYVQDVASGEVLLDMNAGKPMMPASNQKILTAVAALEHLGANYRYRTILYLDGRIRGSVFEGDLIIRGSGDPTFGSSEVTGTDPLRQWARRLSDLGITEIRGRIIGDDDVFDDEPYAEGWDIDYVTNQPGRMIGVSTGGLSYSDNLVSIRIRSGRPGGAPDVVLAPSDYLTIDNRLTTSSRTRGINVNPLRIVGEETVRLTGSVPRSYEGTIFMPVSNPTLFTLHSFARYIRSAGIELEAQLVDVDDLERDLPYDRADPLFVHFSPPMTEVLHVVNKVSNNFFAEQVYRTFGYEGSSRGAERRVKELIARAGGESDLVSARDGSGLSRKDLITPENMGRLLTYVNRQPYREHFFDSLPGGGEPRSTLRYRLRGVPIRAKTGSIEFVRALSGYATTADGRTVSFSIMANHYTVPSYRVVQTIDQMVVAISQLRVT